MNLKSLQRDNRLLREVASKEGQAVIRAVMRHFASVLRVVHKGDIQAYLASVECSPQWASVIRACARLEKRRKI